MKNCILTKSILRIFLLFSLAIPLQVFAQSCSGSFGNGYREPYYVGPYPDVSGNFIIRVFVHFIGTSTWTSTTAKIRMKGILDNLNNEFNQHGIYFVPYDYDNGCSDAIANSFLITNQAGQEKAQAYSIDCETDSGEANGQGLIPDNYVSVVGTQDDGPASLGNTLIHEVGHTFGLAHTFEGSSTILAPVCNEQEDGCPGGYPAACNCCGDFVCETPINSSLEIVLDTNCFNSSVPSILHRNYMSYVNEEHRSCRDLFSEEQVKRMRYFLKNHPDIQEIQIPETVIPGDNILSISGDIIVESGTHSITTPLQMLPGAKIVVKKGARLKIYATITACNGMWEGIIVEGTPLGNQSLVGGINAQQGWVSLYADGQIEHAKIGIRLETADGGYGGGGILFPCTGSLTNCTTSIKFGAHPSSSNNAALIQDANFYLDSNYRGEDDKPVFIDALFVTHLKIRGTSFEDDRSTCTKAIGIAAKASSILATSNQFHNLSKAIVVDQQLVGAFQAINNYFYDCYHGIESNKNSNFAITGNIFQIASPPACSEKSVGITLSGNAAGFTFSKNTFTGLSTDKTYGSIIQATQGGVGNRIFDNDYDNLLVGNLAEGNNGGDDGGMTYVCNSNTDCVEDYLVNGSVWTEQKDVDQFFQDAATGNTFSGIAQQGSFKNQIGTIKYFFTGAANNTNPQHFTYGNADFDGVEGEYVNKSNSACTATPTPCNPCPPTGTEVSLKKTDYYEKHQERDTRKEALAYLTDTIAIQAEKDSISNLKRLMEFNASFVAQAFAQDTSGTAIQADSILAWLERSETYSGDLERLNHYFFAGELESFDDLQGYIPIKHDLAGDDLGEFEELGMVYDLLRPMIEEEESLSDLDTAVIDSIKFWRSWCSEPGFLAKSILRWNGMETVQDCVTPQKVAIREYYDSGKNREHQTDDSILIYPNPANNNISVSFKEHQVGEFSVAIFNSQGKQFYAQTYTNSKSDLKIQTERLPTGLYFLVVIRGGKHPLQKKFSIQH